MRAIIFNGPPGCGKDTVADLLSTHGRGRIVVERFGAELKERCHAAFGLIGPNGSWVYDGFERVKDEPIRFFEGRTPRQAYASFGNWVRATLGPATLGRWLVRRILLHDLDDVDYVVIPDAGFRTELAPVVAFFGPRNCDLIRIRRDDHTFIGDPREWIDMTDVGVAWHDLTNNGDLPQALKQLREILPHVFGRKK